MKLAKARFWSYLMALLLLAEPFTSTAFAAQKLDDLDVLRLGTYRKLAPLNPFEISDTFSTPLMELVFNRLVRYDARGEFEPDLAKNWKISQDGRVYTFFLREGVKFHDGTSCTAQDVMHSLKMAADPSINSAFAGTLKIIEEMNAVSDSILEIKLKEPFSPFLLALWRVYIISRHQMALFPRDLAGFLKNPQGTGPFILSHQDNSGMKFKKNPAYFEGAPVMDEVDVYVYSDKDQMWSAFLRDELDLFFYMDWQNYSEINRHSDLNVFRSLSASGYALVFNLQRPLLKERKIREAIAHAINRQELIDVLENGQGALMNGPFHPDSWVYSPSLSSFDYNPEKTAALLGETQGEKEENITLNLLLDSKNDQLVCLAKLIRQQLSESRISVKFHFFENYQELKEKFYKENQMDAYLLMLSTGPEPDGASRYWFSSEAINRSHYSRADVDSLFNQARISTDRNVRARAYQQIQKIVAEDKPAVFLYYPYANHAASSQLRNAEGMLGPFILFQKLKDVRKEAVKT